MTIISPSILSADFANLEQEIKRVEGLAQWLHLDIMDGHFVPNISFGVPVVKSIKKVTNTFLDTHLMIENPINYIDAFYEAGSDLITFHYEATLDNTIKTIEKIKSHRIKAGISIKPDTPYSAIEEYIDLVDLVLIMTVNPGFSGQKFIEEAANKISLVRKKSKDVIIQVDGGINADTSAYCKNLGANCLVAGNYIYKAKDIKAAIEALK